MIYKQDIEKPIDDADNTANSIDIHDIIMPR